MRWCVCGLWVLLFTGSDLFAQPMSDLGFADHLYHQHDYYRAVTEYQRLLSGGVSPSLRDSIHYRLGWAYYQGQFWKQSAYHFEQIEQDSLATPALQRAAGLMVADVYLRADQPKLGLRALRQCEENHPHWAYLMGWAYLQLRKWREAQCWFEQAGQQAHSEDVRLRCDALSSLSLHGETLPQKSPEVAGFLSAVVPGLGLIYAGKRQKGLLALLLNGVCAYYTVDALRGERYGEAGAIVVLLWRRYYEGTLRNSIQAAHQFNREQYQSFYEHAAAYRITLPEDF
ncbi:MAG: hypothetical protein D6675_01120 [Gemmatimonadetes bacterium]|nr:MAG: hypothetical protein D6675_01120 [Gemmatimonadota bacterium]